MVQGTCKLTGETGHLVRSHLIPASLTRPEIQGAPMMELNSGSRPKRRWSSWYDTRLVIRKGEDVLLRLDNWAVGILREKRLIWSGWGSATTLGEHHSAIAGTSWGIREVHGIDRHRLRLFYLSLLWRAAATARHEFSEVAIPGTDLEEIRRMLLENDPGRSEFYPITLTQISTRGPAQNMVPIAQEKQIPNLPGLGYRTYPIFRFYFEGLIAHVHRQATGEVDQFRPGLVGEADPLVIGTVTYERSFQRENLGHVLRETRFT
jgi:hypothetical protein